MENQCNQLPFGGSNHSAAYEGMTEQLVFTGRKYERTDMAFLAKISSLDYGKKHRVLLIGFADRLGDTVLRRAESALRERFGVFLVTVWESLLICILPEKRTEVSEIKDIYHFLETEYGPLKLAASTMKYRLEDCNTGLQEATRTYDMIETMRKYRENIMFYEDLGIFGLLYELNETAVFETYYNSVFREIWEYDAENEAHLFETLECYFRNECDKAKTAEELYIHENTLRYRLHQIEEILDKDLKNVNVIADIVTAFKVRRMTQILDKV